MHCNLNPNIINEYTVLFFLKATWNLRNCRFSSHFTDLATTKVKNGYQTKKLHAIWPLSGQWRTVKSYLRVNIIYYKRTIFLSFFPIFSKTLHISQNFGLTTEVFFVQQIAQFSFILMKSSSLFLESFSIEQIFKGSRA